MLLGLSTIVVTRWGKFWFAVSLGIVVGIMMVCYVAVPSRLVGIGTKTALSRRDKLAASVVGGAVGAVICTPPYALGRVGLILLGSSGPVIFAIGVILFAVGITLQAGATGAVKTVKVSAKLVSRQANVAPRRMRPAAAGYSMIKRHLGHHKYGRTSMRRVSERLRPSGGRGGHHAPGGGLHQQRQQRHRQRDQRGGLGGELGDQRPDRDGHRDVHPDADAHQDRHPDRGAVDRDRDGDRRRPRRRRPAPARRRPHHRPRGARTCCGCGSCSAWWRWPC